MGLGSYKMQKVRKFLFAKIRLTLVFFSLFLMLVQDCNACDCDSITSVSEATYAFEGRIKAVKRVSVDGARFYAIKVRVNKKLKGIFLKKNITVLTPCLRIECCGINFALGELYLFACMERYGYPYTNLCTVTHRLQHKSNSTPAIRRLHHP
jgi:hypothetical protein